MLGQFGVSDAVSEYIFTGLEHHEACLYMVLLARGRQTIFLDHLGCALFGVHYTYGTLGPCDDGQS